MRRRTPIPRIGTEMLEPRKLMAAALVLTGAGTSTFYLRENADHVHLDVWQNSAAPGTGTPTESLATSQVTTVAISGGVSDAVTLDFTNGNPFSSTVAVTGGTGTTNELTVTGSGSPVAVGSSGVTVGTTAISFAKLQGIQINGTAGNDVVTQTAQPAAPVVFSGGGGSDTLNVSGGTFCLAGDPAGLAVNVSGELFLTAAAAGAGLNVRHFSAVSVAAGGSVTVNSPPSWADRAVVVASALSVAGGGALDLSGNDLIVRNAGASAVTGVSSTFVGRDAAHLSTLAVTTGPVTFDKQAVAAADVVVASASDGDANLDGVVDGSDYTRIDNGWLKHLGGWVNGDFNHDGTINGSDYTLIDNAFNSGAGTPAVTAASSLKYALSDALDVADEQTRRTLAAAGTTTAAYPRLDNADGSIAYVKPSDWTTGTWAGLLWQLYESTGNAYYKTEATAFTTPLSVDQTSTGDVGFEVYDSFYPLLQQNPGNAADTNVLLTAAASKSAKFNATVGAFEAWRNSTSGNPAANFNVLMDYIMDSQLLFWAAAQTGEQTYYNEAVSNAVIEETYNVHADGSSSQFSYFNSATGAFVDNETYQGYSNTSTWARGQAWAIYGFTQCYAATGRADFLATAEKSADWFLAHLPADDVPYWDFDAPVTATTPRDTSAAAVAASGLLRLSQQIATSDPASSARYRTAAGNILASLCSPAYLNSASNAQNGVLLHGALNVPANPSISDTGIDFGDYYFVEAVNEYLSGKTG